MLEPELFNENKPKTDKKIPILISVPHAGTAFPSGEIEHYRDGVVKHPEDTDWLVNDLYDFATKIGITVIKANYSRYVVDLNRDPQNRSLYQDKRLKTQVLPTVTFGHSQIYRDLDYPKKVQAQRIKDYHTPYYQRINAILNDFQNDFKHCLFFDAHSIKRQVESIQKRPFVDLIIGTRDQTSCDPKLGEIAYEHFKNKYTTSINTPFKGGNLTQTFGKPNENRHALQLEMSQDIYLEPNRISLSSGALRIKSELEQLFLKLSEWLNSQNN